MTITIHITEHGRVWPAEEIAAFGEVFATDAPLHDLQSALGSRGYRVTYLAGLGREISAEVEHDVPAVTGESVTDEQIRQLKRMTIGQPSKTGDDYGLIGLCDTALRRSSDAWLRDQLAAAINARRGVR